jgi:hypothetical protein
MEAQVGKKLAKIQESLRKTNEKFNSLSKAEQRVQIAKDVIKQLDSGKLVAESIYFNWNSSEYDALNEKAQCLADQDSKTDFACLTKQTTCQVCGIGSLFVAALERDGRYKLGGKRSKDAYPDREDEVAHLAKYFDADTLQDIEDHFEQNEAWSRNDYNQEIIKEYNETKRLKMIMENIIKNKGDFVPIPGRKKKIK